MRILLYYIVFIPWFILSLFPLRFLYFISDLLYYLVYYLLRYRRVVVRKNLSNSFPKKTSKEVISIEKSFYHFFCDYIVETIKLLSISEKQLKTRMKMVGVDSLLEKMKETGKPCILYLGHYCNWEWLTSLPFYLNESVYCGQIYHPLENKAFDKLFLRLRGRFGSHSISMSSTLRQILKLKQEQKPFVIGFISDQTPIMSSIHHWVDFLNQDTPVFTGSEKIAKKTDCLVYYGQMSRLKRGYYQCNFKPLFINSKSQEDYKVTDKYIKVLEEDITESPPFWLWSHNRWKRTRKTNL